MAVTTAYLVNTGTCLGDWDIMQSPQENTELVPAIMKAVNGLDTLGSLLRDATSASAEMTRDLKDRMQCTNRVRQGSKTSLRSCNDRYRTPLYEGYILVTAYCIAYHAGSHQSVWNRHGGTGLG